MKFVTAAFVFILALSIAPQVLAEHTADHNEVCTADKKENCTEAKADHKAGHGSKEDHHEKLGKEMNSLFPQKQKDAGFSTRPTVVKLTSPKFLAKVSGATAKLEWTAADGASSYHVQVATDPNFKWLVANELWVKGTSFEATQLEADHKYYWRVASVKGENDSMFIKSLFVNSAFTTQK